MALPKLTKVELRVMDAIWRVGPASVREIQEALPARNRPAYTTVQTVCERLTTKGLLTRRSATDLRGNPYIYEAAIAPTTFTQVKVGRTRRLIASYGPGAAGRPGNPFLAALECDGNRRGCLRLRLCTHGGSAAHGAGSARGLNPHCAL